MSTHVDYLVIGAGPAGLQLAYFLQQRGRDYLVLERGESAGHFFKTYPRHRMLISINKCNTGYDTLEPRLRWDWNSLIGDDDAPWFSQRSRKYFPGADDMVAYLDDWSRHRDFRIRYQTTVTEVRRGEGGLFEVSASDGAASPSSSRKNSWGVSRTGRSSGGSRNRFCLRTRPFRSVGSSPNRSQPASGPA